MRWVSSKHEIWKGKNILNNVQLNKGLDNQKVEFYELNIKLLSLEISSKIDKDDLISLAEFILKELK